MRIIISTSDNEFLREFVSMVLQKNRCKLILLSNFCKIIWSFILVVPAAYGAYAIFCAADTTLFLCTPLCL